MLPFRDIVNDHLGIFLRSYFMVILTAQVLICVYAFINGRGRIYKALNILHFIASFLIFTLVMDGTFRAEYLGHPRTFPFAVELVYSLPWWIFAAAAVVETIVLILLGIDAKRDNDKKISYDSIKEAVDLLPDGMAWYQSDGKPVLVNKRMSRLATALTGDALSVPAKVWNSALEQSKTEEQPLMLQLQSGETMLLRREEIEQNGIPFLQLTSEDISEQYRITNILRGKNEELTELRRRYTEYSRNMVRLESEKSVIFARADIHGELGHALLLAKGYLNGSSGDRETLTKELKQINDFIIESRSVTLNDIDPCENAISKAERIGLKVNVEGKLPDTEEAKILFARALDECSSNAAKHSGTTLMNVKLEYKTDKVIMSLSHNGNKTNENKKETGGLLLLRYEIESAGGTMTPNDLNPNLIIFTFPY